MGRTKWSEIRKMAAPETLQVAAQKKETLEAALELRELARERGLTQEALAERLEQAQGNVSRLLRRSDMHISTLRQVVEAMGGELKVHAHFPDGKDYRLRQFEISNGT
jgi:transcriptional regulator with XRE-family HTH domain